jgi:hypothetical protein
VASAEERKRLWPRVSRHNMGLAPIMHPGARGRYDVYQQHTTRAIPLVLLERHTEASQMLMLLVLELFMPYGWR